MSNKTEIKTQTEHQKVKSQIQRNCKLQPSDENLAGEGFQLQKFLSTGRSVLSEVTNDAKIILQSPFFYQRKETKIQFHQQQKI